MSWTASVAGIRFGAMVPGDAIDLALHWQNIAKEEHGLWGAFKFSAVEHTFLIGPVGAEGGG